MLREKQEKSDALYNQLLQSSRTMDACLTGWNVADIEQHLLEVQKLQKDIREQDLEIGALQMSSPVSASCRELYSRKAETIREILSILEKNKIIISRMLSMLGDDLTKSRTFRNAAGGYLRKSQENRRTLEKKA